MKIHVHDNKYRAELWEHYGCISVEKIKQKTGCDRVLMQVFTRRNVKSRDFIAIKTHLKLIEVLTAWSYFTQNQAAPALCPTYLLRQRKKKTDNITMRVMTFSNSFRDIWVERRSRYNKIGKTKQNNTFILLYKI